MDCLECVPHEHGVGHRSRTPGHGRDRADYGQRRLEVDVSEHSSIDHRRAKIDDHSARLNNVARDQSGFARGYGDYVRLPHHGSEVPRSRVGYRHGGVADEQEVGHRATYDAASADHDRALSLYRDFVVVEESEATGRGRGHIAIET